MNEASNPIRVRFGSFELDLRVGELRQDGRLIKMQDQPIKLLGLLVTRPGELVTRSEIQKKLWSESRFVEVEHGINTAMRKIREALGDESENPRFIETLPRKGYRFMVAVERLGTDPDSTRVDVLNSPDLPHHAGDEKQNLQIPESGFYEVGVLRVGEKISNYRIEEKIGHGGMAIVYRARDLHLGRIVALKMVLPEFAARTEFQRRLAIEARAAGAVNHPVIATMHAFEQVEDKAFIIYEYVEGATLRAVMRQKTLGLRELLSICIRIADGLGAAHEAGVIHRDIKPENIMITESGRVKVLDLGLAKVKPQYRDELGAEGNPGPVSTGLTGVGVVVGTVNYMSPEQCEGKQVDHRTDIFSFGVMLYEMIAGRRPFTGNTPISTMGKIVRDEPPEISGFNSKVPEALNRVLKKCIRKDREERYASFREVVADLENVRENLDTKPVPPLPVPEFALARQAARGILLLIQCGYLAMYVAALYKYEALGRILEQVLLLPAAVFLPLIVVLAMCGIAVRLYLLSAIGLDHPETGIKFKLLFPVLLVLDALWASAPLFLERKMGLGLAMGSVAALAYLPFSQRTLIKSAYPYREKKTS